MLHDVLLTAAQLKAAADWANDGDNMAAVELLTYPNGTLKIGQGDERAHVAPSGAIEEV